MTTNALIANHRGGRRTQSHYQYILEVPKVDTREKAEKLLGKTVTWRTDGGKTLTGSVTRVHGDNGRFIARFESGLPGQALGTTALLH